MKVGCYLRVSTDEQTVENQRGPLAQLAAARDWEPVWYEETWSGRDDKRPQLQKLLEDCRKGRVQAVAVVALDRLTRKVRTLLRLYADFDDWGTKVVSLRENWTDLEPRLRDLVLHALGLAAEWEVDNLRERTRAGMKRAKKHGTKTGRPIGRPKHSRTQLAAAVALIQSGVSLRKAAKDTGVSARSIKRRLEALAVQAGADPQEALDASRNAEGGGEALPGTPTPSSAAKRVA